MAGYCGVPMIPNCIRTILSSAHPLDIAVSTAANKVCWGIAPGCLEYALVVPKNNVMLLQWAVDEKFFRRFLSHSNAARKLRDKKDDRSKFCNRKERELLDALNSYHKFILDSVLYNPHRYNTITTFIIDLRTIGIMNADFVRARPPESLLGAGAGRGQGNRDPAGRAMVGYVQRMLRNALRGGHGGDDSDDDYGGLNMQMARYEAGYGPGYDYGSDDDDKYGFDYPDFDDYDDDDYDEDDDFDLDDFDLDEMGSSEDEADHFVLQLANAAKWEKAIAAVGLQSGGSLQNFAVLEYGSCTSDFGEDEGAKCSPDAFHRSLRIDRLLASMTNLRTLYMPSTFYKHEKSYKRPIYAWKALEAMPAGQRLANVERIVVACCDIQHELKLPLLKSFTGKVEVGCRHRLTKEELEGTAFRNASEVIYTMKRTGSTHPISEQISRYLRLEATNDTTLKKYREEISAAVLAAGSTRNSPMLIEISPWCMWTKHTNNRLVEALQMILHHNDAEFVRVVLSLDIGARLFGALKILTKIMPLLQRPSSSSKSRSGRLNMELRLSCDSADQLETAFADLKSLHSIYPIKNGNWQKYNSNNSEIRSDNISAVLLDDAEYDFPDIELHFSPKTSGKRVVGETAFLGALRGWTRDALDAKHSCTAGQGIRYGDLRNIFYHHVTTITFHIPATSSEETANFPVDASAGLHKFEHQVMCEAYDSFLRDNGADYAQKAEQNDYEVDAKLLRQQFDGLMPFPKLKVMKEVPKRFVNYGQYNDLAPDYADMFGLY